MAHGVSLRQKADHAMGHPTPSNESKRLKVLWQYEVLDTVPEEMFDDLTELAASICAAPIALVSLVDEDRQWFKSTHGVSLRETSRDISFCAHAICQCGLFVVPDARKDVRFKQNPMVTGAPKIRFYAGSPLVTPDGYALGTLCVLDKKPRRLSASQQRALELLARVTVSMLELRRQAKVPVIVGKTPRPSRPARSSVRRGKPRGARSRRS
jgi:GAF domain-containing protein